MKVFIVEDNINVQSMFAYILKSNGFNVVGLAANGEEAISMFRNFSEKPDIILMDHRMPIKNGIDATKEILALDKSSKIIFVSGDNSVRIQALSIGAAAFILKPVGMSNLINKIESVMNAI